MNIKTKRKCRQFKLTIALLCGIIGLIIIGSCMANVEPCQIISYAGRIVSSISLVGLAWVLVSVFYGYLKRTTLIVLSFLALLIYGLLQK